MANSLQKANKPKFTAAINSEGYKKLINNTLGNPKKAKRFVTAITSAVTTNPQLQNCDAKSIVSAGLLGEALNLSPSPQLGQYYMVPYGGKAQFQLGYKGYIQLAIRSGQYKKLNVVEIKDGELISYDPLTEEIKVNIIEDEVERENAQTVGYYAMFEYTNGFTKSLYWSKGKMEAHANAYSQGYKARKGYTFWEKDFDAMAKKTMLRQLISKWGIMSIEMQNAIEKDMAVINEDLTPEYVDNEDEEQANNEVDEAPEEIEMDPLA